MPPKQHRRLLPLIILNLVLWIICGLVIVFLSPENVINIVLFLSVLVLSLGLTLSLLLANKRRGFLLAALIILVLILCILL